jgi:hypothetical protein
MCVRAKGLHTIVSDRVGERFSVRPSPGPVVPGIALSHRMGEGLVSWNYAVYVY